jgi:hypothetical protein
MEDPVQSAVGRDRRLILAVIVALGSCSVDWLVDISMI